MDSPLEHRRISRPVLVRRQETRTATCKLSSFRIVDMLHVYFKDSCSVLEPVFMLNQANCLYRVTYFNQELVETKQRAKRKESEHWTYNHQVFKGHSCCSDSCSKCQDCVCSLLRCIPDVLSWTFLIQINTMTKILTLLYCLTWLCRTFLTLVSPQMPRQTFWHTIYIARKAKMWLSTLINELLANPVPGTWIFLCLLERWHDLPGERANGSEPSIANAVNYSRALNAVTNQNVLWKGVDRNQPTGLVKTPLFTGF